MPADDAIGATLEASAIFRAMSQGDRNRFLGPARLTQYASGTVILASRQSAERLHVIGSGQVVIRLGVTRGGRSPDVATLSPGMLFGQGAVNGAPEFQEYIAKGTVHTVGWDQDELERIFEQEPSLRARLVSALSLQGRSRLLVSQLHQTTVFREVSPALLHALIANSALVPYEAGHTIFEPGSATSKLYLVVSGTVQTTSGPQDAQFTPTTHRTRELLGHLALLSEHPHRFGAEAVEDTELLEIDRREFDALQRQSPEFAAQIARLSQRQIHRSGGFSHATHSITIVNRSALDARALARSLGCAIHAQWGERVICVSLARDPTASPSGTKRLAEGVEEISADVDMFEARLEEWLERERPRHVLLFCRDFDESLEHHLVSTHADVLFVTDDPDTEFPHPTSALQSVRQAVTMGGLTPGHALSQGAIRLALNTRDLDEPEFRAASKTARQSLARLARAVTHRSIGVALGGGGAWGYSHHALLRAMEKRGLTPDGLSGVSFGALAGAAYASDGLSGLERLEKLGHLLAVITPACFLSSHPVRLFVRRFLSAADLETLAVPLYTVAVDISTGTETVFRSGPVSEAVRASGAFPGLFGPAIIGGRRYVDGAIANNVPASVLPEEGFDFIVASDVMQKHAPKAPEHDSRWARLLSETSPLRRLDDSMRSTFTLMQLLGAENTRSADAVFHPFIPGFVPTDFHRSGRILELAERQAEAFVQVCQERYEKFCRNAA